MSLPLLSTPSRRYRLAAFTTAFLLAHSPPTSTARSITSPTAFTTNRSSAATEFTTKWSKPLSDQNQSNQHQKGSETIMSTLAVIGYNDIFKAEEVRISFIKMQRDYLIDLEDAV